jgi:hypothetical protein
MKSPHVGRQQRSNDYEPPSATQAQAANRNRRGVAGESWPWKIKDGVAYVSFIIDAFLLDDRRLARRVPHAHADGHRRDRHGPLEPRPHRQGLRVRSSRGSPCHRSARPSSVDPEPEAIVSADDRWRVDAATQVGGVALLQHAYSGQADAAAAPLGLR